MLLASLTLFTVMMLTMAWFILRTIRTRAYHAWPRPLRWPFLILTGVLLLIGASLIIGRAIIEFHDQHVGLGTGVIAGLIAGLARLTVPSRPRPTETESR